MPITNRQMIHEYLFIARGCVPARNTQGWKNVASKMIYPSKIRENKIILDCSLSMVLEYFRFGSLECTFIRPLLILISGERINTGK